ncbi:peroxiredoxin [Sphingomonas sp. 1P06PA]|uniref:peroxiredoxin n=1 Tax=Sphingomonas sp. 1P06PA TaxID=554121 RepID=UPI0039A55C56
MTMGQPGETMPDAVLETPDGGSIGLSELRRPLVVYFYPKDDTPGCTREAQDFSSLKAAFDMAGVSVIGISRDPAKKKAKFIDKYDLKVPLATDPGALSDALGVWGEKSMYGRTYMGMERTTFLVAADGTIAQAWRKVKVPGHAEAVLAAARALGDG